MQPSISVDDEIADLIDQLALDPLRAQRSFSADIEKCHETIFEPGRTRYEIEVALREWLRTASNQPCLFGRLAAAQDRISFCILTEGDIERGDAHLREVIQRDRRVWKAESAEGRRHAFVVALISKSISTAVPNGTLKRIAEKLCDLYLFDQRLEPKRHDVLRIKANDGRAFRWLVGVNVFAAQADGRWWNDHRIPGGLAFSMNSVGHMTFVRHLEKYPSIGVEPGQALVNWALPFAMRTIKIASERPQFGTCLMERSRASSCPAVPEEIRSTVFRDVPEEIREKALRDLAEFSEHIYEGWYDTDESIPESYFHPEVERPDGLTMIPLFFTYLHSLADEDYASMGMGEQLFVEDGDGVSADSDTENRGK